MKNKENNTKRVFDTDLMREKTEFSTRLNSIEDMPGSTPKEKSEMSGILRRISSAVDTMSSSIKRMTDNSIRVTGGIAKEYSSAIKEEFTGSRQSMVTMSMSHISPVLGFMVSKMVETPSFQKLIQNAGNKLTSPFKKKEDLDVTDEGIPKLQHGGFVMKEGYAKIHAAEVVAPIEKITGIINDKVDELVKRQTKDNRTAIISKKMLKEVRQTKEGINRLETILSGIEDITQENLVSRTFQFLYKPRGGYYRYLSRDTNVFSNIKSTLQTLFVFSASRLDAIRGFVRQNVLATRDLVTYFTGKKFGILKDEIESGFTVSSLISKGWGKVKSVVTKKEGWKQKFKELFGMASSAVVEAIKYHFFWIPEPDKVYQNMEESGGEGIKQKNINRSGFIEDNCCEEIIKTLNKNTKDIINAIICFRYEVKEPNIVYKNIEKSIIEDIKQKNINKSGLIEKPIIEDIKQKKKEFIENFGTEEIIKTLNKNTKDIINAIIGFRYEVKEPVEEVKKEQKSFALLVLKKDKLQELYDESNSNIQKSIINSQSKLNKEFLDSRERWIEFADKIEEQSKIHTKKLNELAESSKSTNEKVGFLRRIYNSIDDIFTNIKDLPKKLGKSIWGFITNIGSFFFKIFNPKTIFGGIFGSYLASELAGMLGVTSPLIKSLITIVGGGLGSALTGSGIIGSIGTMVLTLGGIAVSAAGTATTVDKIKNFLTLSKEEKLKKEMKEKGYAAPTPPDPRKEYGLTYSLLGEGNFQINPKDLEKNKRTNLFTAFNKKTLDKLSKSKEKEEATSYKVFVDLRDRMTKDSYNLLKKTLPDNNYSNVGSTLSFLALKDLIIYDQQKKQWMTQEEFITSIPEIKDQLKYRLKLFQKKYSKLKDNNVYKSVSSSIDNLLKEGKKVVKEKIPDKLNDFSNTAKGYSKDLNSMISETSKIYGVSEDLLKSMILVESSNNPNAISSKGAKGLMQLMPSTASDLGVKNVFDPKENITGGASYLKSLMKRYDNDIISSLAAYNWGMGNVDKYGLTEMPNETRKYIANILHNAQELYDNKPVISKESLAALKSTNTIQQAKIMSNVTKELKEPLEGQERVMNNVSNNLNTVSNILINSNLQNTNSSSSGTSNIIDPECLNISQGNLR